MSRSKGRGAVRAPGRGPSERQRRVAEELRHALVRALGHARFADPELADKLITVTEVRVSPDLKNATCFVTPLGGEDLRPTTEALNRASGYLRGLLADEIRLRHLPRLSFEPDRSFDEASHIAEVLNRPRVRQDIEGEPHDQGDAGDGEDPEPGAGHGA